MKLSQATCAELERLGLHLAQFELSTIGSPFITERADPPDVDDETWMIGLEVIDSGHEVSVTLPMRRAPLVLRVLDGRELVCLDLCGAHATIALPVRVEDEIASASFRNGVLDVTLRAAAWRPRRLAQPASHPPST